MGPHSSPESTQANSPILAGGGGLQFGSGFRFGQFQSQQPQQPRGLQPATHTDPHQVPLTLQQSQQQRQFLRPPVLRQQQQHRTDDRHGSGAESGLGSSQSPVRPFQLPLQPFGAPQASTQGRGRLSLPSQTTLPVPGVTQSGSLLGSSGSHTQLGASSLPHRESSLFDLFDQLAFRRASDLPAPPPTSTAARPLTRAESERTGQQPQVPPHTPKGWNKKRKKK